MNEMQFVSYSFGEKLFREGGRATQKADFRLYLNKQGGSGDSVAKILYQPGQNASTDLPEYEASEFTADSPG